VTSSVPGRVWFITGGSSGFGSHLAQVALAAGDRVMVTARDVARLSHLVNLGGERLATARLDLSDPATIKNAVQATLNRFGRVDVAVNNAGSGWTGTVEELTMGEIRAAMDVLYFGPVEVIKAVAGHLRRQGSGTIVQISSVNGRVNAKAGFGAYGAGKFALEGLSEALAVELAPFGVRVLIVEPGLFRTEILGPRLRASTEMPEYREINRATRELPARPTESMPGDPAKAATAIMAALDSADPPRRLVLGPDAVAAIREQDHAGLDELEKWAPLGNSTDFD
jgi:NAD(P)-dependent dehydrogenase (short-subunit alcohol dehydrogenase family)